jgi:hypothetical protein
LYALCVCVAVRLATNFLFAPGRRTHWCSASCCARVYEYDSVKHALLPPLCSVAYPVVRSMIVCVLSMSVQETRSCLLSFLCSAPDGLVPRDTSCCMPAGSWAFVAVRLRFKLRVGSLAQLSCATPACTPLVHRKTCGHCAHLRSLACTVLSTPLHPPTLCAAPETAQESRCGSSCVCRARESGAQHTRAGAGVDVRGVLGARRGSSLSQ